MVTRTEKPVVLTMNQEDGAYVAAWNEKELEGSGTYLIVGVFVALLLLILSGDLNPFTWEHEVNCSGLTFNECEGVSSFQFLDFIWNLFVLAMMALIPTMLCVALPIFGFKQSKLEKRDSLLKQAGWNGKSLYRVEVRKN